MLSSEKRIDKELSNRSIATKLPAVELQKINDLVEGGVFLNSSDFLREAIRDKLRAIKIVNVRDVDYDTAKKEVLGYYQAYEDPYMSDVVDDLELDLELVVNITDELIKEGRVKPLDE